MEKTWQEKKKTFKIGTFAFLFLIVITFIQTPEYEKENLTYKTIELNEEPEFRKNCNGRGSCSYSLELNPKTTDFNISGIDYKYLKHRQFKRNIKIGDKLTIGVIDDIILTLSKNGTEYLQFNKAQFHKQRNRLFSRYLFSTGFMLCLIPLLFNKQPKIKSDGIESEINFGWILGVGLAICLLILISTIGLNFISGGEFAE
ncbi:hypothetical protein [Winogradskyella helgolandensis]|uniref:hypothetical protein n=1 Tax=Winogradskyella helgolandensis TaxID=2697010 RepID=UPI0015CA3BBB|nr:hypothetical protein [Winogradskyella helgolandensis]